MASTAKILLIEDDPGIVMTLRRVLTEEGHQVQVETRGDNGLKGARGEAFDVVITDMKLPGLSGLDLVRELHGIQPRLPIILITAHGTTETAIEATKAGAYDYLLKPFEIPELIDLVEKAVASRRDRKSTRLNSSHDQISYAVFCLKKKNQQTDHGLYQQTLLQSGKPTWFILSTPVLRDSSLNRHPFLCITSERWLLSPSNRLCSVP